MDSLDDLFDPATPMSEAQLDALSAPAPPRGFEAPRARAPTLDLRSPAAQLAVPPPTSARGEVSPAGELIEVRGPALDEDLVAAGLRARPRRVFVVALLLLALAGGLGWWSALEREALRSSSSQLE